MLAEILALFFLVETQLDADPTHLVVQLGSSSYVHRVAAEAELARLGRSALPALLEAKDSMDLEIRSRSRALIERIGRTSLLESTPIRLDFQEAPLLDVIASVATQSKSNMILDPAEAKELAQRNIALRSREPLPFWSAIDSICSAGKVHPSLLEPINRRNVDSGLTFLDGARRSLGLVSDSGPFRVWAVSISRRVEIDLPQTQPRAKSASTESIREVDGSMDRSSREFCVTVLVSVEPRLSIMANGSIELTEAIDDGDHSLLGTVGHDGIRRLEASFGITPSQVFSSRIDLDFLDTSTRRIKLLRGSIPVVVSSRKPGPLEVPLDGSSGRFYQGKDVSFSVIDFEPASVGRSSTVRLAIRTPNCPDLARPDAWPSMKALNLQQSRLEILDAEGRVMPAFSSGAFRDDEEIRLTLTINPAESSQVPTTVRYYEEFRVEASIPFEFRDLPMP